MRRLPLDDSNTIGRFNEGGDVVVAPVVKRNDLPAATGRTIQHDGDTPIAVLWGGETADALDSSTVADGQTIGSGIAFDRTVSGQTLTLSTNGEDLVTDAETSSTWNLVGRAVDGHLVGEQMDTVSHRNEFWFAWASFFPTGTSTPGLDQLHREEQPAVGEKSCSSGQPRSAAVLRASSRRRCGTVLRGRLFEASTVREVLRHLVDSQVLVAIGDQPTATLVESSRNSDVEAFHWSSRWSRTCGPSRACRATGSSWRE